MTSTDFERFVKSKKALLAERVQGCGWLHEEAPDRPSVNGADSPKEHHDWPPKSVACNAWDLEDDTERQLFVSLRTLAKLNVCRPKRKNRH